MSAPITSPKDRVPILQKAAFGAGNLVNNLLPGALGVFSFFLLTAFGMDPFLAGLLGGLPRLFDAITDPIMGYISDNTQSRYGRRRPYIFAGAILSGVFFILLWQLDPEGTQMYNFWYFLLFSLIFIIGNTIFSAPLIGLGYEMTPDYNERTRLMGFAQTIGQVCVDDCPLVLGDHCQPKSVRDPGAGCTSTGRGRGGSVYGAGSVACDILPGAGSGESH
jgi:glycoside/pentoside/hexuronide:cation symporter, GPH family